MEISTEFWWEAIEEYIMSEINESDAPETMLDEYYGHLQILFIDKDDVEDQNSGRIRFYKILPFENVDELEPWLGKQDGNKWKSDFNNLSEKKRIVNMKQLSTYPIKMDMSI